MAEGITRDFWEPLLTLLLPLPHRPFQTNTKPAYFGGVHCIELCSFGSFSLSVWLPPLSLCPSLCSVPLLSLSLSLCLFHSFISFAHFLSPSLSPLNQQLFPLLLKTVQCSEIRTGVMTLPPARVPKPSASVLIASECEARLALAHRKTRQLPRAAKYQWQQIIQTLFGWSERG